MALIYIVEDEENIGALLTAALGAASHSAIVFGNAAELEAAIENSLPQLLILDIMLPGKSGWTVLKEWVNRPQTASIPVIILSAKGEELDKVRGLEGGAQDYITKPFGVLELQSRVKKALRAAPPAVHAMQIQDLTLDFEKKEILKNGHSVRLTHKEMELLEYLAVNAGLVISREQLIANVWGDQYEPDTTRTVDYHIRALRQKLEDDAEDSKYIETVRGYGYRLKKD